MEDKTRNIPHLQWQKIRAGSYETVCGKYRCANVDGEWHLHSGTTELAVRNAFYVCKWEAVKHAMVEFDESGDS